MASAHNFKIVVGTDFSEQADRAVDEALRIASVHGDSEVHVVNVQSAPLTGSSRESAEAGVGKVRASAQQHVEAMSPFLQTGQIRRVVAHFRHGLPSDEVVKLAAQLDADEVVVGSHGHRGLARALLGSVAEKVARNARCAVTILRPKDHPAEDRVPEIEPPCAACVDARRASGHADATCARHSESHYLSPHTHHYSADGMYAAETVAYEFTPEHGA